jgi:hypothetical protein
MLALENSGQVRNRGEGTVQHIGSAAGLADTAIAFQRHGEPRQAPDQIGAELMRTARFADDQRTVQPAVGDRVRGLELPSREVRLHEFKAEREPVDASEKLCRIIASGRRGAEMHDDFGFDARFQKAPDTAAPAGVPGASDGCVVHVRPDRFMHIEQGPEIAVAEADLAADRGGAVPQPRRVNPPGHVIGRVNVEFRQAARDRLNRLAPILRGLQCNRDCL